MKGSPLKSGFTLIEIIVSLALFAVVAVVALGAVTKIISANEKAQTIQAALTNLNFALESMSREMRVGSVYNCSSGTTVPAYNSSLISYQGSTIAVQACLISTAQSASASPTPSDAVVGFISSNTAPNGTGVCSLAYAYRFKLTTDAGTGTQHWLLQKAEQTTCSNSIADASFSDVLSPDVFITDYRLGVTNSGYQQGFIRMVGYAGTKEQDRTYFDIQTSVSSRLSH